MGSRVVRVAKAMLVFAVAIGAAFALAIWHGNRDVAPLHADERLHAFKQAVSWMRANEVDILQDDNVALWWFVSVAAEHTGDEYLRGLFQRFLDESRDRPWVGEAWRRMVEPDAEVVWDPSSVRKLEPYQRFFYHALTCVPVALSEGVDTNVFLQGSACHPLPTKVWVKDPVCTTHQLVGVVLLQRRGCKPAQELVSLRKDLLDDIREQMAVDVVVKDAYLQRVMMLMWQGDPDSVKPIWLQRALRAQQPDGGWIGGRQMPELPQALQPWFIRSQLAKWWPSRFHAASTSDFHASAQGLLITALALKPAEAAGGLVRP